MCKWSKVHPAQGWLAKLILLESWPLVGEWNSGPLNGQAIWDYWLLGYFLVELDLWKYLPWGYLTRALATGNSGQGVRSPSVGLRGGVRKKAKKKKKKSLGPNPHCKTNF